MNNTQKKPIISLIACVAKDRGIGKNNKLLFNLPEDLKYFKKVTTGHTVIMGYNTYKSIGKPLPKRRNIVLNKKPLKIKGCEVYTNIDETLARLQDEDEFFFIGGASIYKQCIEFADRLYITEVDAVRDADTFFPDYSNFSLIRIAGKGKQDDLSYRFLIYERR